MTTYTPTEAAALDETREHIATFYGAMMRAGANVQVIGTALAGEPNLTATLHECHSPYCEDLTDTPTRDEQAVFWMGDNAPTYCDPECMWAAAEHAYIERATA